MLSPARSCPLRRQAAVASVAVLCLAASLLPAVASGSELRRSAIVKAVEGARSAIVNIHGQKTVAGGAQDDPAGDSPRRVNGMGTGVVIDERGYIVTNHHVVQGVRRIQVTLADGKNYYARLVSFDPQTDLAVIKIDHTESLPVITLGTSSDLMEGEEVIAVGNAYGYEHTVTRGIISSLHRTVQVSDTQQYEDLIQTDAAINPGNSGGPLLNIDGEMIGVNVAVRAGAQGIGFAIPINKVLDITARLMSTRKVDNHWHGIEAKRGDDGRLIVSSVETGSPAEQCGLQVGDVITRVNKRNVARALDIERALIDHKTGDSVEVTIERDSQSSKLSLALASTTTRREPVGERSWDVLGVRVQPIPADQFRQANSRYRGGLLVSDVRSGSPAEKEGIRAGDILVGMHIWETVSLENLSYVLNRPDLADLEPLKFYIVRGEETLFGHLTVVSRVAKSR